MPRDSIPQENRSNLLKPFLEKIIPKLIEFRSRAREMEKPSGFGLHAITYPLVVHDEFATGETAAAKNDFESYGLDGALLVEELKTLLNDDEHLSKCCVNPLILAKLLDQFILNVLDDTRDRLPSSEQFDSKFEIFSGNLYFEPFTCLIFSHIFNFDAHQDVLDFAHLQIRRLGPYEIPYLLAESTTRSLLHPYMAGDYFVVQESTEIIEDDLAHIGDAHLAADDLVMMLQYFKDGVVHLNYTTNLFRPLWLNSVRKYGSLYWGDNRRLAYEQGRRMYRIDENEFAELHHWFELFLKEDISAKFNEPTKGLGKKIDFAGTYYRSSHTQVENERRLIDLTIALESAFSPSNVGEITFQLSQFCAEFVGDTSDEKLEIFRFVKKMYDKRSSLLHGDHNKYEKHPVTIDELERFSSIIRRGLLQLVALYVNGEDDHENIIELIRDGLFDPEKRNDLKARADIRRAIETQRS